MSPRRVLIIIACITILAIGIDSPRNFPLHFTVGGFTVDTVISRPDLIQTIAQRTLGRDLEIKQGLDLQGGTQIVLKADMTTIAAEDRDDALESAKEVINRRIDLFGVNEPRVQTSIVDDEYRIITELPGVENVSEALTLIGTTAQLDFRELAADSEAASPSALLSDFVPTQLTGQHLKRAGVDFGETGQPVVTLEFNKEGAEYFSDITARNVGKPVAIFLDNQPVSIPTVNQQITGGRAVISGEFTTEEANNVSIQLNAGALPVPIEVIGQKNIGASLGANSVEKSIRAGVIGLTMVMLFMALYYGRLGIIANVALVVYGLITLALYKLIPVTLTLPGLAGFILSVGMAVDSNILIFERMKEELRMGKEWSVAMELGFGRAWDSIKDANVATLITAFILFNPFNWNFLNTSGLIRGFALTLTIGILISLFTGIIVTRTLMRVFYKQTS